MKKSVVFGLLLIFILFFSGCEEEETHNCSYEFFDILKTDYDTVTHLSNSFDNNKKFRDDLFALIDIEDEETNYESGDTTPNHVFNLLYRVYGGNNYAQNRARHEVDLLRNTGNGIWRFPALDEDGKTIDDKWTIFYVEVTD